MACKKHYKFLDFNKVSDYSSIKGTKDVLAQKITGMIYWDSTHIVHICNNRDLICTSVYAVYNGIFMLLKTVIGGIFRRSTNGIWKSIDRHSLERENKYVKEVFIQYELIIILSMLCFLSVSVVLIMPFIKLYTADVSDINYSNWPVATLSVGISFFEIIHLPSGNIINMAGRFRISR